MEGRRFTALPVPQVTPDPSKASLSRRRKLGALPALNFNALKLEVTSKPPAFGDAEDVDNSQTSEFHADFELGAVLGSGSVGVVFQAKRRSDARQLAVKCITTRDDEMRQFTRDEYELVKSLSHPAIIKFEACYESSCKIWICMEFCSDGSVDSYLKGSQTFDEAAVQKLGSQLLRGINYLHHKRVVHRDLKPANMVLTRGATVVKITDFNSAKCIGQRADSSLMLSDRGTSTYSAPELRFGLLWNERVDIWAFGLSVYFMVRKRLPFNNQDPQVAEMLANRKLPVVDWDGFSDSMQNFIQQCLLVDMHDRPPAMALLLHPIIRMNSPKQSGRREQGKKEQSNNAELGICVADEQSSPNSEKELHLQLFVFRPKSGLLALHNGRTGLPELQLSPMSPSRKAGVYTGPATCYLFSPDSETPEGEEEPRQKFCWSSWKEPHRFDALLHSAESKFCS
mmetsp:Transcript_87647/g.165244  ORF Transcript_87647/g.165244 Transcript_87647/m.165244 type:complete len:454 (-) Transcript_87647:442-1803(-)